MRRTDAGAGGGGIFFRAQDPDALTTWYREQLGIGAGCAAEGSGAPEEWTWKVQGGPLVFAQFTKDTDYWAADQCSRSGSPNRSYSWEKCSCTGWSGNRVWSCGSSARGVRTMNAVTSRTRPSSPSVSTFSANGR